MSGCLTNISLFSGAGGLDIGLEQAGFETRVCVVYNRSCLETLEANRPKFRVPSISFHEGITKIPPLKILEDSGLKRGDATLVSGGLPCQSYNTAGKRGTISDPRWSLFFDYVKVIDVVQPRFS